MSKSNILTEEEIKWLCNESKSIFMSQPVYLELISPLYVGGNLISDDKINKKDFMFLQIILHFQSSGNYFYSFIFKV